MHARLGLQRWTISRELYEVILPTCENEFLNSVLFSLKKRQKAIKYKVSSITCEKIVEIDEGERFEKLEIDVQLLTSRCSFRIFAWDDRWVWIDARRGSKNGWKWEWSDEGRLLGSFTGRDVVDALEFTQATFFEMDSSRIGRFSEIWDAMLAKGLKPVV